jgi:hypothetical protein
MINNVNEKVLNKKYSKVYNYGDVLEWIKFGINNKLINFNNKEEIIKWIGLLKGKMIEL